MTYYEKAIENYAKERKDNALSEQVAVRLTAAEKAELERRADSERLTVSRYIHRILFG